MENNIIIKGARQHNLKNINLDLPKNRLIVFTGLSGSGKSSLAFDTIYAEGQRRYVESLSSYARQFLGIMDKPDVDAIEGLSPAISIDQKTTTHNPRSTVGTITEIYDYLRLLFARVGHPHCHICGREITRQTLINIIDSTFNLIRDNVKSQGRKPLRLLILSPMITDRKGEFSQLFENLKKKGFTYARVDGRIISLREGLVLIKTNKHTIETVIDRLTLSKENFQNDASIKELRQRLSESLEQAIILSEGIAAVSIVNDPSFDFPINPKSLTDHIFSEKFSCPVCNISLPEIEPRIFSFNSPHGACPTCSGIGSLLRVDPELVINPRLTIMEGGILPFARLILSDSWYGRILLVAVKSLGIDKDAILGKYDKKILNGLLNGTGEIIHEVSGNNRYGRKVTIFEKFSGVISELEKRYMETESDFVRNEINKYMRQEICPVCIGYRLKKEALSVTIDNKSIIEVTMMSIAEGLNWIKIIFANFNTRDKQIAKLIMKEIENRLSFLNAVGLDYLSLDRNAGTLAGGEAQRIRLASQIGSGLSGVLYVLDEPSIGLHPRDNYRLIETLYKLKNLGNTIIVVEHDREMMEKADYLVDFGPGAGEHGGFLIAQGAPTVVKNNPKSLTGKYLTGKCKIEYFSQKVKMDIQKDKVLTITHCQENNLKDITVSFPLKNLICITGVSGSGKSTLIVDTLYQAIAKCLNPFHKEKSGKYKDLIGLENIRRVILIDQSPIGRTPRSNPATYTGVFSYIRELFAQIPEAKMKGYKAGRFSFNVKGGRCEACEGEGVIKIEMQFMPDVYITCDVCNGTRFNSETLDIKFKDKNIAQVLSMTVEESTNFFKNIPGLSTKLKTLHEVGLSYIHLGQPAPQLSGGEAQRVKLASELAKKNISDTLYILDEPTTGLHFEDLKKLLIVLKKLVSSGNTVIVIEHNPDIIKNADWIIDLGPEGGNRGGYVITQDTISGLLDNEKSFTGIFIKKYLHEK
jgi:excinuclease ABC subunit A